MAYVGNKGAADSVERSFWWEAGSFWAGEEIPYILWHSKIHYRVHKSPPSESDPSSDESSTYPPILFLTHPLQYTATTNETASFA